MPTNNQAILTRINDVLAKARSLISSAKYDDLSDLGENWKTDEIATLMISTIDACAPLGSIYSQRTKSLHGNFSSRNTYEALRPLFGTLTSLQHEYEQGYMRTIEELIHADLFSDFLEMAGHLLEQGYKDAAAVIIGSVLEEHLRKLADKSNISRLQPSGSPKKADTMNADLASANAYSKLDQKSVTAWLDLRNKAAHGNYDQYQREQVTLLLDCVRDFLSRCPA